MGASVKIMLSYNFCHFEITKHTDQELTNEQINEMRKEVQRLADEAVRQYIIAKDKATKHAQRMFEKQELQKEIDRIKEKPQSEWSATDKAKVKAMEDVKYWDAHRYDYEDDYEDEDY
jgi:histidinol dehydrogenase